MGIPLDLLIDYQDNIYELTSAAIKRALQVSMAGGEDAEANEGKIVTTALDQILSKKVDYRLEE